MDRVRRRLGGCRAESGFSIVESTIALGLVFAVLVGMLATLSTSVRSVVGSRQRNGGLALVREVLELARSVGYASVGHDLDGDSTLSTDPDLVATGTYQWTYEGETLAGSNKNQDPDSPFYPHRWTRTVDGTDYTVSTYVTLVTPTTGEQHKRVTAVVEWTNGQQGNIGQRVESSSLVFDAVEPPDPLLEGIADVDAGAVKITGTLQGTDLASAFLWLPTAHGEIESRFIRRANGLAVSPRSQLNLNNSAQATELTGCTVTNSNKTAECAGVKAESVADNDSGTAPAASSIEGPATYVGGTVSRQSRLTIQFGGSNSATSKSTASATTPDFGENDGLPWHQSDSTGPASASIPYQASQVDGKIMACSASARSTTTVDVDDTGSGSTIDARATVTHPATDVLTFDDAVYRDPGGDEDLEELSNYAGLVRVGATSVTASAAAGPGAAAPSLSGSGVSVQLYDAAAQTPGYTTHTFTPGVEQSATTSASLVVEGRTVVVDATVTSARSVVDSTVAGALTSAAEASVTSWLRVLATLKIYNSDGSLAGDLTIDLDYGRVLASAGYEEVT